MNYRDTQLVIDMSEAFKNIEKLKKVNNNKKVKAVVKANAYGHGLGGFSYILEKYDMVSSFCVSSLDEALELRNKGLKLPILVLGAVNSRHFNTCLEKDISITVYSKEVANQVINFNGELKIQFKIDTAMNRIGFICFEEFKEIYERIKKTNLCIEGIFSHFCSAEDEEDISYEQIKRFKQFVDIMPKNIEVHIQNSAGSINYNDIEYVNTIRLGIGMYGLNPVSKNTEINLVQIATLESRVIMLKSVLKNQTISYNRTYKLEKDTKIATVPLGYADGFKLIYKDSFAYTYSKDGVKKFPIRGKICMDQIMIEVDESVKEGDYVTFIGKEQSIAYLAEKYNISMYEILTSFSERLYKVYKYNGEIIYEDNQVFKI